MSVIVLSVFGVLGVLSRYFLDQLVGMRFPSVFPWATLLINVLGSGLAGIIYVLSIEARALNPLLATGLLVGFCGGFTTFSAYSLQTFLLVSKDLWSLALTYLVLSPILGLGSAWCGVLLARWTTAPH